MESDGQSVHVELVSGDKRFRKLLDKPTFKYCTYLHNLQFQNFDNLAAIALENKMIKFDISKTLMYHYRL